MSQCNHCVLNGIRRRAEAKGACVSVIPLSEPLGGFDVFVVPAGDDLDTTVDTEGNHGEQWRAWLMGISETCAC